MQPVGKAIKYSHTRSFTLRIPYGTTWAQQAPTTLPAGAVPSTKTPGTTIWKRRTKTAFPSRNSHQRYLLGNWPPTGCPLPWPFRRRLSKRSQLLTGCKLNTHSHRVLSLMATRGGDFWPGPANSARTLAIRNVASAQLGHAQRYQPSLADSSGTGPHFQAQNPVGPPILHANPPPQQLVGPCSSSFHGAQVPEQFHPPLPHTSQQLIQPLRAPTAQVWAPLPTQHHTTTQLQPQVHQMPPMPPPPGQLHGRH